MNSCISKLIGNSSLGSVHSFLDHLRPGQFITLQQCGNEMLTCTLYSQYFDVVLFMTWVLWSLKATGIFNQNPQLHQRNRDAEKWP